MLRRVRSWFGAGVRRSRMEREMDAELRFHIEVFAEDLVGSGVSREEALRRARIEFGGVERAKEECRDALALRLVDHVARDLRLGVRLLIKNPGFAPVAVIALALGIGADTAMHSIVKGALSWDFGLDHPDRVVIVNSVNTGRSQEWGASYPDFRDFRAQVKSLAGLAAYQFTTVNLSDHCALPDENLALDDVRSLEQRIAESRLFAGSRRAQSRRTNQSRPAPWLLLQRRCRSLQTGSRSASRGDVARLVFGQGVRPLAPGEVIGLLLAFGGDAVVARGVGRCVAERSVDLCRNCDGSGNCGYARLCGTSPTSDESGSDGGAAS